MALKSKDQLIAVAGLTRHENGLEFSESFTFERWEELGGSLKRVEGAIQWWIGDWICHGEQKWGDKYKATIEATGYEYQSLRILKHVSSKIELLRRRNKLSWSHHREVAPLESKEQNKWLKKAESEGWSHRELRTALRREPIRLAAECASLVDSVKPSPVIVADPPWQYDYSKSDSRKIENQYPTMELDEIAALEVPSLDDSVLFLWATSPKLEESLYVVDAWGFDYKTCMVWVKDKIGMGYYARQQHELILIATKGDLPTPDPKKRPSSVLTAPRGEHSAKPDEFVVLIESMYPTFRGLWLELFARTPRAGWQQWGSDI